MGIKEKRVKVQEENIDKLIKISEALQLPLSDVLDRIVNKAITTEFNHLIGKGPLYIWKS